MSVVRQMRHQYLDAPNHRPDLVQRLFDLSARLEDDLDQARKDVAVLRERVDVLLASLEESHRICLLWQQRAATERASAGHENDLLTVEEAAGLAHVSRRTIYHWIEAGRLHPVRCASGRPRVRAAELFQRPT